MLCQLTARIWHRLRPRPLDMRPSLLDMALAPEGLQPPADLGVKGLHAVLGDPNPDDHAQMHVCVSTVVTDGAFTTDGTFIPLPRIETEPFEKLWQRKVFDLLLERGKIDESLVRQMLNWQHSGFHVHLAVRLGPDDLAGRQRLAQYMLRCPFSLQRMLRVTAEGKVLYLAEKKTPRRFSNPASADLFGGVARNFQLFDPLLFSELTQHIPDTRKHLGRNFG